jgi:hypothetical protein
MTVLDLWILKTLYFVRGYANSPGRKCNPSYDFIGFLNPNIKLSFG